MDDKKRMKWQAIATLLQNANLKGFFTGEIYQGQTKNICVPGLNCYSCPGAVGACPIGALQNALSEYKFRIPYYVLGLMIFFGTLLGRFICGFLCPFGFLQDLLHKIPFPIKIKTFKGDRVLRKLKYMVLLFLVVFLPVAVKLTPFFCKYVCPSGTLSGILLSFTNTALFAVLGTLFTWKVIILILILAGSMMIYRPFCKYLCPLGAFYAPFNQIALVRLQVDSEKCTDCHTCQRVCEMGVNPAEKPVDGECIRCGKCASLCPAGALRLTLKRE